MSSYGSAKRIRRWEDLSQRDAPRHSFSDLYRNKLPELPDRKRPDWSVQDPEGLDAPPQLGAQWIRSSLESAVRVLGDCIEVRANKCSGVPVLRGTRFKVAQVLGQLADGDTVEELADKFDLDQEQVARMLHAFAVYFDRRFADEGSPAR